MVHKTGAHHWQLLPEHNRDVCCFSDTFDLLRAQSESLRKAYRNYFKIVAKIRSESFIPLRYKDNLIGLINCHYAQKKSIDELIDDTNSISALISEDLPIKFIRTHRKMAKKARAIINSIVALKPETKKYLISLCQNLFVVEDEDSTQINGIKPIELFENIPSEMAYIDKNDSAIIKTDIDATIDIFNYYLANLHMYFNIDVNITSVCSNIYSHIDINFYSSKDGYAKTIYNHIEELTKFKWHSRDKYTDLNAINAAIQIYFNFIGVMCSRFMYHMLIESYTHFV